MIDMMSIPRITKETITSVTVSMEHDEKYFNNFLSKIKQENPLIYELIQVVRLMGSSKTGNSEAAENYLRGVCTVYKLIESQLESQEMNNTWGKDDG